MTIDNSGYHDCPCRDCFEIAIGCDDNDAPDLCAECEEAGCDADGCSECSAPYAYGVDNLVAIRVVPSAPASGLFTGELVSVAGEIFGRTVPCASEDGARTMALALASSDGFEVVS